MLIREAEFRDLVELVQLENQAFQHDRITLSEFSDYVTGLVDNDLFVVRENGSLTGYGVMIYLRSKTAYLYSLYSKNGHGYLILRDLEQAARQRGKLYVRLEVKVGNYQALRFYRRNGYRSRQRGRKSLILNFYEDGSTAMELIKKL